MGFRKSRFVHDIPWRINSVPFTSRRYHLDTSLSPTHFNLSRCLSQQGWKVTRFNCLSSINDKVLLFNEAAAQTLEYKHLLAQLVADYCPQIAPQTFCVDEGNWQEVVHHLVGIHAQLPPHEKLVWILKPALLNNGQHIRLFDTPEALAAHYVHSKRMGGMHVLQRYLSPHLLRDDRKYSIRLFVILTNYDGAFCYKDGYFNVALHPYVEDFSDLRPHLTNEHLLDPEVNVIQIPASRFAQFSHYLPQIDAILQQVLQGLRYDFPEAFRCSRQRTLALFGFDFMVDSHERVWLLEANHGPCFPIDDHHPLQAHLYQGFWQGLIHSFIEPIADNRPVKRIDYPHFNKVL
ncbi:tubulin-tyrosine ligase [Legionella taurinensis]|uniref:Tubulin--tyrosine ligase n=1 Tax=Legionella taurinensis TaxID=70611 RepID=A0A3A5LNS2_9GAMM|nr:tubulin-tyrosine ligase [Legionella taurinensis]RJT48732.1 tubulin-tyrosine ligase [Legionella taurinensis]RJT69722.1 tubulin-tyrosine ligase [Legionella taurinensis]